MAPARGGPTVLGRGSVGIAPDGRRRGAALGLLSVAIFVGEEPVGAQEAESTGVGISLDDLSSYPTHLTVDGFMVELTNLTATEEYQVTVSSDSDNLGIGGCGTASQTKTVTGVETQELRFVVYACTVGEVTVTAEVRLTDASSPEASVSQQLQVEAIPENAIGARGQRVRAPAARAVPKAGTPGSVPNTYFRENEITSTSARARWERPSDGGTPLTGYGVLFWEAGNPDHPGYKNPLVLGPNARSRNFPNLQPGTTYNFQIHACNGPDSCGYWTVPIVEVTTLSETTPTAAPSEASTSTPAVAVLRKRSTGKNTVTVEWDVPSGGSDPLSGYHVQHREDGATSWPTGSDVVTPGSTTSRTLRGLINGTPYNVRIQACYGTAGCSAWTALRDADDPVIPGNKVGNARIEVSKKQIKVGERLQVTIYDIPVGKVAYMNMYGSIQPERQCPTRASRSAAPRAVGQPSTGGWYDSGRIEGCADGGLGHIRVTNRDESELYAYVTITVGDTTPPPPETPDPEPMNPQDLQPPLPPPSCDRKDLLLPPAPTDLDPITNLAIEPQLGQRAVLRWDKIPAANDYNIKVRRLKKDPVDGLTWGSWHSPIGGRVTRNCYTINLAKILAPGTAVYGIHNTPAFGFRVTASRHNSTPSSAEIILVDNPITVANGHSPTTDAVPGDALPRGKVNLKWKPIPNLPTDSPGTSYADGTYYFRYRRALHDHNKVSWAPGAFVSVETISEDDMQQTVSDNGVRKRDTIGSLYREAIYALQLIYVKHGQPIVYSAMDAYVWPSNRRAVGGQRVATFPLTQRLPSDETYVYRVCDETFDVEGEPRKKLWLGMIDETMGKWQSATKDLIRTREESLKCIDYSSIEQKVFEEMDRVRHITDKSKLTEHIKAYLTGMKDGLVVQPNIKDLVDAVNRSDSLASEIVLFDDDPGTSAADLANELNFKQISRLIGYSGCWDPAYFYGREVHRYGLDEHKRGGTALACAASREYKATDDKTYKTTDIVIYRVKFKRKSVGPANLDQADTPWLIDQTSAYAMMLHEIGHALGVGGGEDKDGAGGSWSDRQHPHSSLRNASVLAGSRPSCFPYPFDVLAVYALYQTP